MSAMNSSSSIEDQILFRLRSSLVDSSIEVDTDIIESGQLDSMLVMDLVHFVETLCSVRLDPTDIAPRNFRTAATLARCVAGRMAENRAA